MRKTSKYFSNQSMCSKLIISASILCLAILICSAEVKTISQSEAKNIEDFLIPLPKKVKIEKIATVNPENVKIKHESADITEKTAVNQLKKSLEKFSGSNEGRDEFEIVIGIPDKEGKICGVTVKDIKRLESLKNKEQAYLIQPDGDDKLIVAGLSPKGVYYGVMTLIQLLESGKNKNGVTIPLATITDFPDFADRGFWHMRLGMAPELSLIKLNYIEGGTRFIVSKDKKIKLNRNSATEKGWDLSNGCVKSRKYAVKFVPGITHLDLWAESPELLAGKGDQKRMKTGYSYVRCPGFTQAYPELVGKGDRSKRFDRYQGLCASQPGLVDVLADLMTQVASLGAEETTIWASEYPGIQCECPECLKEGQLQLEVKAVLKALAKVRKKYPDLKVKIFYGRGGAPLNKFKRMRDYPDKAMQEIIDIMPKDAALCAGGGTGNFLPKFAQQGGLSYQWHAGPYPAYWDILNCGAQKLIARHFKNKYHAFCQFTPGYKSYYSDDMKEISLPLSMLAEYGWNTHGRNLKEFFRAWGTRNGINDPKKFAEFATLMAETKGAGLPVEGFISSRGRWLLQIPKAIAGRKTPFPPGYNADKSNAVISNYKKAAEIAQDITPIEFYYYAKANLYYHQLVKDAHNYVNAAISGKNKEKTFKAFEATMKEFLKACSLRIAPTEKTNPKLFKWQSGMLSQIQKNFDKIK